MAEDEDILAALEANGKAFLESFSLPPTVLGGKRSRKEPILQSPTRPAKKKKSDKVYHDVDPLEGSASPPSKPQREGAISHEKSPDVIVFKQPSSSNVPSASKTLARSFMSSKVSRISAPIDDIGREVTRNTKKDDEDVERSQGSNDVELHRLLHTRLLSGSLNPELDLTPAQRRKALEGRVLELAGRAKLGKGEKNVRDAERKKAALHVREGMKAKQEERDSKGLEEAKNTGNYHPVIKKLFGSSAGEPSAPKRKRERGLAMGIGKHTSSGLRLTREEITAVNGGDSARRERHKGRGGGASRPTQRGRRRK